MRWSLLWRCGTQLFFIKANRMKMEIGLYTCLFMLEKVEGVVLKVGPSGLLSVVINTTAKSNLG